ncbi:MAG: hypothetical protein ACI96P_002446 [Candidatus Azotimanducaceae bacterium]
MCSINDDLTRVTASLTQGQFPQHFFFKRFSTSVEMTL